MVEPGIHYKLDWYTAMFENCSILNILDLLDINISYDLMAVYSNLYLSSKGYGTDVTFNFDGINIKTDLNACYRVFHTDDLDSIDPLDFFGARFAKIRMDLSGKALDLLRSYGIDVDTFFSIPFELGEGQSFHVTRADFAFDLVNYAPDFLDSTLAACEEYHSSAGRLYVGASSGMKYSVRIGDQKTLYLGSPRSEQLLRIYDKKLQFDQAHRLQSDCPYNVDGCCPDSWIRIELQTRNGTAEHLLYDHDDPLQIFKFIFEKFSLRKEKGLDAEICEEWLDLFDWENIPRLLYKMQNPHTVSYGDRAEGYIKNIAFSNIVVLVKYIGWDAFRALIDSQFEDLQRSPHPLDHRRWCSLFHKMSCAVDPLNPSIDDGFIYKDNKTGLYKLR